QTIDNGFKYGLIKIRGAINNVATNRAFNDIEVLIYPYSPTNLRGTPINDGTVSLQFTPPIINANITGYKIYTSAGELVGTATQSPAIILGLNNEQTYQFQVSSINRKGESSLSALSNPVTVVNNILQISTYTNNVVGLNITPTTIVTPYVDYRVTYQLNTGYKLDSVIVDNVKYPDSTTGFTFKDVHNSHIIKVYVSKIPFTLTITKNSGGVVSPNQTTITTYYGDTLTVQFTPDNRYKVDSVFINGMYKADAVSSYTFKNIQENNTVRVVFKAKVYYNILVELVGNGNVNTIGIIEVESGTNYVVTYSPQIGNRLDSVIVNNILVQDSTNRYTFKNIQNNAKIRLVFSIKTYTITAVVKNGIVTPSGIKTYNYGTQIKYNYTPLNNSYVLDSLLIDGVLQFNPDTATYTFDSLKENHTIQIVYNLKANIKYTIYITKSVGVTVTPSLDQQVGYGGNLRVTWEANTGYVLDSIFVNKFYNRDSINGYTFTNVRSQQSIYIKYKLKTFTITSSAGLYGTINPLGISVVNYGTNKSFVLLPNVGYETDSLLLNGVSVTKPTDNIYSINNVTANQTIYVTFKIAVVNPCTGTKQTPNIVRVGDALKSDITSFSTQRWYLAGTIKDSTTNNTYTPTDAGVYTLLGVDAAGCESNISKKYYYAKTCITPAGRLGNGAYIQTEIVGNPKIMVIKWCTDLMQGDVRVQVLDISGEQIEDKKIPSSFGTYILNKLQIQSKKFIIKVMDNNGEIIQISDVVNNF
ncbi:MAG: fibronectin type III domain-containing protein, partial [Sediminibacterium sp.]|nr:fibronectin type III domain-containing protein [Sediminibacterium sp.]